MASDNNQSTKNLMIWIHCNKCFENYVQNQSKIFILSCFDVACEKCLAKVNQHDVKCPVCCKSCSAEQINNNLGPQLKELFHPRPWVLSIEKAILVVRFQTKQRDHFLRGCRKMIEYNRMLENERDRVKEECRQAYIVHQKTRNKRKQLEAALKKFIQEESAYHSFDISHASEKSFERKKSSEFFIHPTFNAPRNEDTFDFPPDRHMSKSFVL